MLEKARDVTQLPIDNTLDINEWDLNKTLGPLCSSNPTLFGWMFWPIAYRNGFRISTQSRQYCSAS